MKFTAKLTICLFLLTAVLFAACSCEGNLPDSEIGTTGPATQEETASPTDTLPGEETSVPDSTSANEPDSEPASTAPEELTTEPESLEPPTEELHVHSFGEWTVTLDPTFDQPGERTRTCTGCEDVQVEAIPKLVAAYHIDLYSGEEKIGSVPVTADGAYTLEDVPEKAGYTFTGWADDQDAAFPASGTISADITVFAQFELLETKTFDELKARIEAGADKILLAGDIVLTDTVYVTGTVQIIADQNCTLTRLRNSREICSSSAELRTERRKPLP